MIRFGGRISNRHSELLGDAHIKGASLVAACDPIRARADAIASKFAVLASYDTDSFLARKDMDAVAVLTPSGMHPAHVVACAKAGKHATVDKQAALRLQDADDMIRACDEAGVKLFRRQAEPLQCSRGVTADQQRTVTDAVCRFS